MNKTKPSPKKSKSKPTKYTMQNGDFNFFYALGVFEALFKNPKIRPKTTCPLTT